MEHLLWKPDDQVSFRVQYYGGCGGVPYDGKGSAGYLARHHYSDDSFLHELQVPLGDEKYRHLLCHFQNYTFYGILHDLHRAFNIRFEIENFISREKEDIAWVRTAKFPEVFRQIALLAAGLTVESYHNSDSLFDKSALVDAPESLLAVLTMMDPNTKQRFEATISRLRTCLENVKSFLVRVLMILRESRGCLLYSDDDHKTIVASQILLASVDNLLLKLFARQEGDRLSRAIELPTFKAHMQEKRWCPNRVSGLLSTVHSAVFMAGLDSGSEKLHGADLLAAVRELESNGRPDPSVRLNLRRKLHIGVGPDGIPPCTDTKCLRSRVDEQNMRPDHRCPVGAACRHDDLEAVDLDLLCSMYDGSGFPVIRADSVEQRPQLHRLEYDSGSDFVAFSHVWYVYSSSPSGIHDGQLKWY